MAIQKLTIDMSGGKGLANKWFGDINKFGYTGSTETGTPNLRYLAVDGEYVNGISNPIIKYGYNSPASNTFLSATIGGGGTAISKTIPISLADSFGQDLWFCCNNSHIYFSDKYYNNSNNLVDAVTVSSALQALTSFTDACIYTLNGSNKLFFAWVGSSNGYISTMNLSDSTGASFNENWSAADVTNGAGFGISLSGSAKTLRMIPSGDGFMYILDGNKVHRLDGTTLAAADGTIYPSVLLGNLSTQIHSGCEFQNKLYLVIRKFNTTDDYTDIFPFASRAALIDSVGIYVWNKQSSFYNSSDFIQLPGVVDIRAIWVSSCGDLRIIALESSGEASLRVWNGTRFEVVTYLPFGAMPITQKSLYVHGSFTYWLGNDGLIYAYGSDIPKIAGNILSLQVENLYILGQYVTNGQDTVIGSSLVIGSTSAGDAPPSSYKPTDVFWIGYATATNNGFLKTFYPYAVNTVGGNNQARHAGNIFYPVKILPTLSTVKHVNIVMARIESLATPTQVESVISFYFNNSAIATFTKNVTRADISKGYISIEVNKPFVNSIQMSIAHNTNSNVGVADFSPAYAEVIYETTTTLK